MQRFASPRHQLLQTGVRLSERAHPKYKMRAAILFLICAAVAAGQTDSYDRARELYNQTDYKAAINLLNQGNAQDFRSLELLGRCYLMEADYRQAVDVLEHGVALNPDDSMANLWLGRAYGRRAEIAFATTALGLARKARRSLEKAVQLDARNFEAIDDLFEFYLQAPALIGGGVEKARGLLPLIARDNPVHYDIAHARIALAEKQYSSAEARLRHAIMLAPHEIGRFLDLAKFLSSRGRYDESENTFRQAEKIEPGAPRILYARAECYVRANRNLDQARDLLNRYLGEKLTPDDPSRAEALSLLKSAQGAALNR
jgi:tetratricopeptide (TPR) repeat protein